jgi:hypothetical protein
MTAGNRHAICETCRGEIVEVGPTTWVHKDSRSVQCPTTAQPAEGTVNLPD